ncbi:MAG TPA: S8 family serine peptidase [Solirubrobacterales bacterium]|nr:S8 family serine peptidase [Solirubrobacterales bacterium]
MRKLIVTTALAIATVVAAAPDAAAGSDVNGEGLGPNAYVPGELLVRFDGGGEKLLELPQGVDLGAARKALAANPKVSYALPNYIAHKSGIPNDPGPAGIAGGWQRTQWNFLPCGSLCGQSATPFPYEARGGLNAVDAWTILEQRGGAGGKGARVAVLDTGVAYLTKKPKFRRSPDFSPRQFLPGYDFVDKNTMPLDRDGHGTHIAGTIAEQIGNKIGLTGLAPRAKIMPVRVLDSEGLGTARDIAKGIRWSAKRKAHVINMSFEFGPGINSCGKVKGICSAIKYASKRRALVVAAAGNSNGEPVAYPAAAPHAIGVGRTTKDACLANDSRTGTGLDLVAPGGGFPLLETCGTDDPVFGRGLPIVQLTFAGRPTRFGYPMGYEGTSMAAAHVSGVAAMVIASRVVGRKPGALECQLEATARHTDQELGQPYDSRLFGAGLVDAANAVRARAPGC